METVMWPYTNLGSHANTPHATEKHLTAETTESSDQPGSCPRTLPGLRKSMRASRACLLGVAVLVSSRVLAAKCG